MRFLIAIAGVIVVAALSFGPIMLVHDAVVASPLDDETSATPQRVKVALDCNRPQGHHRWTGDMIIPQDGTVMRVTNGDDHEDIDIAGWLCVIDAETGNSDA